MNGEVATMKNHPLVNSMMKCSSSVGVLYIFHVIFVLDAIIIIKDLKICVQVRAIARTYT